MLIKLIRAMWPLMFVAGAVAAAPARTEVREIKPLLLVAIAAPDGRAAGVLRGADADAITHRFAASSPVFVDVSTLVRYAQPGCRRLAVRVWQEGVRLNAQEAPGTKSIEFGINYCSDGRPPASIAQEAR